MDGVFQRRLEAMVRDLRPMRGGNADALHRTRVASRRVREALPLLDGSVRPTKLAKVRRNTRRITRALGRVRELDVSLSILRSLEPPDRAQRAAIDLVRRRLVQARQDTRRSMLSQLDKLQPARVAEKIAARVEHRHRKRAAAEWQPALKARVARRAKRLLRAIEEADVVYLPERLHRVRVATKQLRYVLELAGETHAGAAVAAVRSLKRVQDLLGRLHDIQILIKHVHEAEASVASTNAQQARDLEALAQALDDDCRRLHARFVARRAALRLLCRNPLPDRQKARVRPRPSRAAAAADR